MIINKRMRWVFLPIEVKVRELRAKVLLSLFLAEAGFGVIIGAQKIIRKNIYKLPKGLYLDKSISVNKLEKLKRIKQRGNRIACLDEEGFGIHNRYWPRTRLSEETLAITSVIFSWGWKQDQVMREAYPSHSHKFAITGNPRFDLLRNEFRGLYAETVRKIEGKYGKYILIPSNFGAVLNASGGKDFFLKQLEKYGYFELSGAREYFNSLIEHKSRDLVAFEKLIEQLSANFKHYNIIIRPHPSDNHQYWNRLTEKMQNVKVIYEHEAIPWILAAQMIIHNGCTTGVESAILRKPAFAYLPNYNIDFDSHAANKVSPNYYDLNSLIENLYKNEKENHSLTFSESQLENHLESLTGNYAAERIVENIKKIDFNSDKFNALKYKFNILKKNTINKFSFDHVKNRYLSREADKEGFKRTNSHKKQKNPGISIEELELCIRELSQILERFNSINIFRIDEDLYCISKKDDRRETA